MISKTDFQNYRKCPEWFWVIKNAQEKLPKKELSDFEQQIIDQGYEVEHLARRLFEKGVLIEGFGEEAEKQTQELIESSETQIFQATFISDDLLAMCDALVLNEVSGQWDIYEIKGTTSKDRKKEDYFWDLAFQREVLERAEMNVGRLNLIELNKEYRKQGEIDPTELLEITDLTEEIDSLKEEIRMEINKAKSFLETELEPTRCGCLYKTRSNHCDAFSLFYESLPDYSIYDLSRISTKKIKNFVDNGIVDVNQIPNDASLTKIQSNQVRVHKQNRKIIDVQGIKDELKQLQYPLYFLDYETVSTAIPVYENCYPFQQVPFQFSLHILNSSESELAHYEYLHAGSDNPIPDLVNELKSRMADYGTVIVWNKSFEGKCNRDMAEIVPEHEDFLLSINDRFYDLRDIFSKQLYVHKAFQGSTSIKKILPVLAPDLNYDILEINEGGMASSAWKKMIFTDISSEERETMKSHLLEYCMLDTLAMVRILEELMRL